MPLYDKGAYVASAVASVLQQLADHDEIVVIDDGSTDDGPSIVQAIGDPRIRMIGQSNAGESEARNRGIREARNEWIAFLDADDEWRPGKLDRQLAILQRSPHLVWAAGGFERVAGRLVLERADPIPDALFGSEGILRDGLAVLAAGHHLWIGTVMARREQLLALGGFDPEIRIGPDVLMCVRLALAGPEVGYVRAPVATYRWGVPGSLMQQSIGSLAGDQCLDRRLLRLADSVASDRAGPVRALVCRRVIARAKAQLLWGRPERVADELRLVADLDLGPAGACLRTAARLPGPVTRLGMLSAMAIKREVVRRRQQRGNTVGAPAR